MPCLVRRAANEGKPHQFDSIAVFKWLVQQETGRPDGSLDATQERALLDNARRREIELRLQEREGVLIPADVVEQEWVRLVHAFRAKMLALPSRVAPLVAREHDVGKIAGLIESLVHAALEELSNDEDDDEPFQPADEQH